MYLAKEFINVGENAYLGKILLTNQLWDKELTVKGVKIEDGVVVNDGCCIGPGTHIKKNTTVLPFSITSKNDVLDSNSVYFDATVKKIKTEEELIKILNFKPI
jgi:UDP-3-O-[3-hydroxymyristoyl] glucosamine N-acyltransferase